MRDVSRSSLPRHGRSSDACRRTWRRRRVPCGMATTPGFSVPPTVRDRARRLQAVRRLRAARRLLLLRRPWAALCLALARCARPAMKRA
eukprot:3481179-Prymnesium_polylepis.1